MQLLTDRLILRHFVYDDWPAMFTYQSDPRYLRYYEWTHRTPEDVQAFVQMFLCHQQEQPRIKFQLAVTLKETQQLIGNCGICIASPGAYQADIGYATERPSILQTHLTHATLQPPSPTLPPNSGEGRKTGGRVLFPLSEFGEGVRGRGEKCNCVR